MAKLSTVVRHEYLTIIKQPSFWIAMIAIPVLIGVVIALSIIGNKASEDRINELAKDLKNVVIVDESGLINDQVITGAGLTKLEGSVSTLAPGPVGQASRSDLDHLFTTSNQWMSTVIPATGKHRSIRRPTHVRSETPTQAKDRNDLPPKH